ncbi:MAG: ImmA/IrrE family metallo-endopeptidase [Patulibacter sp.]|nr:ImmA/IrrE family metallo-endopeptidase [Patulibacter sp.]
MSSRPTPITDLGDAIAAAGALRRDLGIEPDRPLGCAVSIVEEHLDLDVVIARLPAGCSGFYLPRPGRSLIAVNGTHAVVRQRFTVAHEAGHHVLRHGAAPRVLTVPLAEAASATTVDRSSLTEPEAAAHAASPDAVPATPFRRSTDARERAANAFAAEMLCPASAVRAFLGHSQATTPEPAAVEFDQVVRLSAAYGISAAAVLARLETAEVLADPTARAALQARIEAAEHIPRYGALGLTAIDDELEQIAALGVLPRLPEGISGDVLLAVTDPDRDHDELPTPIRKLRRLLGVDPPEPAAAT